MPGGCDPADIAALDAAIAGVAAIPARLPEDYRRLLELVDPDGLRVEADVHLVGPRTVQRGLGTRNPDLPALLVPVGGEGYFVELELATDTHPGGLWVWDPGLDDIHRVTGGVAGLLTALADAPAPPDIQVPGRIWVDLDIDALFDEQVGWEPTDWPDRWLLADGTDPGDLSARHTETPTIEDVLSGTDRGVVHARVQVHAGTMDGSIVRLFDPDHPVMSAEQVSEAHLAALPEDQRLATIARIEALTAELSSDAMATMPLDTLRAKAAELETLAGLDAERAPSYRLAWWPRTAGPAGPARNSVVELALDPGPTSAPTAAVLTQPGDVVEATVVSARHVRDASGT